MALSEQDKAQMAKIAAARKTMIDLEDKDQLAGTAAYTRSIRIEGLGRGGKPRDEQLEIRSLNNARAARGRKGKAADLGFKPATVVRVE